MPRKLTSDEILREVEDKKDELNSYGVRKIGLFGSFQKGQPNNRSDLDFIVSLRKSSFDNYMGVRSLLEKLFGRKIDLVTEKALKPRLRYIKDEALYARL